MSSYNFTGNYQEEQRSVEISGKLGIFTPHATYVFRATGNIRSNFPRAHSTSLIGRVRIEGRTTRLFFITGPTGEDHSIYNLVRQEDSLPLNGVYKGSRLVIPSELADTLSDDPASHEFNHVIITALREGIKPTSAELLVSQGRIYRIGRKLTKLIEIAIPNPAHG